MITVEQFIDALGGTVCVANALELAPTTVSSWKTSNSIPKWRRASLKSLAAEQGVQMPDAFISTQAAPVSPDNPDGNIGDADGQRTRLCESCDRSWEDPAVAHCTQAGCPRKVAA